MFNREFLTVIRADELDVLQGALAEGSRVLELGGGTGQQARMLSERGFDVVSLDVEGSEYRDARVFPVIDYDGRSLPLPDDSFDVVLSSNVLEHVEDLAALLREMARVLRPGGVGVHAMPSHSWRIWTCVSHYGDLIQRMLSLVPGVLPRSFSLKGIVVKPLLGVARIGACLIRNPLPRRHGERGNALTEVFYFHPTWWRREFASHGYRLLEDYPMGLFYTGHMVLGSRLGLAARRRVARVLGSAGHLFVVSPGPAGEV